MSAYNNPHFDDNRVIWQDEYADTYKNSHPDLSTHFDLQWKLSLEKAKGYETSPGANTDDEYIKDRVLEWTGARPGGGVFYDPTSGIRTLDHPIDPALINGKECIDIGCGRGR